MIAWMAKCQYFIEGQIPASAPRRREIAAARIVSRQPTRGGRTQTAFPHLNGSFYRAFLEIARRPVG
jgi:hypothetical protein